MIKLAVFDVAGILVFDRDLAQKAISQSMAQFGFPVTPENAAEVVQYSVQVAIGKLLQQNNGAPALAGAILHTYHQTVRDYFRNDPGIGPANSVVEGFEKLRAAGVKIGLGAVFTRDITEIILDRLHWYNKVDAWVASDMVLRGKPYGDMIHYLMQKTGVSDVQQVATIGDSFSDILEGRLAGVALIVSTTNGRYSREELAAEQPDSFADNLLEATDIILSVGTQRQAG